MTVTGVVVRRRVDDLAAAVPFYEALTGEQARRFSFAGAELASVGPFLLFSARGETAERLAAVVATVQVPDVDEAATTVEALGAEVVAPATTTPNGRRLVVRHPDGGVFEYVSR